MCIDDLPLVMTLEHADVDPSSKPYWRWKAANALIERPKRRRGELDAGIVELVAYLKGKPCPRRSQIDTARAIFEEDGLLRAELEARILAGQTDEEIAERCDLTTDVVAVYEELFFFVRRYLRNVDWIHGHTNGVARINGYDNHQLRQLWAWFAMAGGPVIVDYLVTAYRTAIGSNHRIGIDVYFDEESPLDLSTQGYLAMFLIPPDWAPEWEVMNGERWKSIHAIEDPLIRQQEQDHFDREFICFARKAQAGEPYQPLRPDKPKRAPASQKRPSSQPNRP